MPSFPPACQASALLPYCGVGLDMGPAIITQSGTPQTRQMLVTGEVSLRVLEAKPQPPALSPLLPLSNKWPRPSARHALGRAILLPFVFFCQVHSLISLRL